MSSTEKDVLQKIVEGMDISDNELELHNASSSPQPTSTDKKESPIFIETVDAPKTTENKVSEKNEEEESIENIQSLLNSKEAERTGNSEEGQADLFMGVYESGAEEEDAASVSSRSSKINVSQEIPQVMLDQLDLQKFPNLKINKNDESATPKEEKKSTPNAKLIQEIRKRMENRRTQQKKIEKTPVEMPRGRRQTKKVESVVSFSDSAKEKPIILSKTAVTPKPKSTVETKPAASPKPIIRLKNVEELKATPKASHIKKTPLRPTPHKVQKKPSTDIEEIDTDDGVEDIPLLARPRSSRKIKLTDKFKSFVAQEKTIMSILIDDEEKELVKKMTYVPKPLVKKTLEEGKAIAEKKPAELPRPRGRPRSDIQIQLKRKKETSEEEDETEKEEEEEEEKEELNNKLKGGRSLRNRKPVKKTPLDTAKKPAPTSPKMRKKKELLSESELSDGFDDVDDEDRDPDFHDSDIASEAEEGAMSASEHDVSIDKPPRNILDIARDVFLTMPTWNLHMLPNTNSFCLVQITRGVNGTPMLKKCIEIDSNHRAKVFVHQIHYKKYDGIYDSEDHLIQLLLLVDAM